MEERKIKIKTIEDVLKPEEIADYHRRWESFEQKNILETEYNAHSGMPVISKIFRYKDTLIFRARIFQKRLRSFDPYFKFKKYVHPFYHFAHYFIVTEQMYHASSLLIRDRSKLKTKTIPEIFSWRLPIFWNYKNVSVQLIMEEIEKQGGSLKERQNFTFYNDRNNRATSRMSFLTSTDPRAHICSSEKIKGGDKRALEKLIRQIEMQDVKLHKWSIVPRKNFQVTKDYLIQELKKGNTPEGELDDFFSLWDKE